MLSQNTVRDHKRFIIIKQSYYYKLPLTFTQIYVVTVKDFMCYPPLKKELRDNQLIFQ